MSKKNITSKKFMTGAFVTAVTLIICTALMLSACLVSAAEDNPRMKITCSDSELEPGDVFTVSYYLKGGSAEYVSLEVRVLYGCEVVGMDFYGDDVIKYIDRDEHAESVTIKYDGGSSDEFEHVSDVWLRVTEDFSADSVYLLAGGTFCDANMQSTGSLLSRFEVKVDHPLLPETQHTENLANADNVGGASDGRGTESTYDFEDPWVISTFILSFIVIALTSFIVAVSLIGRGKKDTE